MVGTFRPRFAVFRRNAAGWVLAPMKRIFAILLPVTFLTSGLLFAAQKEVKLVASNYSDRYHVADCKVARKITDDERITFNTPEEALAAGLQPCKKCCPPTAGHPKN